MEYSSPHLYHSNLAIPSSLSPNLNSRHNVLSHLCSHSYTNQPAAAAAALEKEKEGDGLLQGSEVCFSIRPWEGSLAQTKLSPAPERSLFRATKRPPRMGPRTGIYIGDDVKISGELGRMYDVNISGGENRPKTPPRPSDAAAVRFGIIPAQNPRSGHGNKLSSSSFSIVAVAG